MAINRIVWAVQGKLNELGHFRVNQDGLAGPGTWGAIAREVESAGPLSAAVDSIANIIRGVQRRLAALDLYHGEIDGAAGPLTWNAIQLELDAELHAGLVLPPPVPATLPDAGTLDARTEHAISTLHPRVQPKAREFILRANAALRAQGLHVVITSATRSAQEQADLYAQGRTAPGPRVTNAPPWYSNHNFWLAFDVTIFREGTPVWESPLYRSILAPIGKALGFVWGGDWANIVDEPHYQLEPDWAAGMGESAILAELRRLRAAGLDVFTRQPIQDASSASGT